MSTRRDLARRWNATWTNVPTDDHRTQRVTAHLRVRSNTDQIAYCSLKEEVALLEASHSEPPLFVSYFTKNTPYEALANQLRRSLDRFGLPHRIEALDSLGTWVANTGLKSKFIEKMWHQSDKPICWIDADAEILRPPTFVFGNPFDIALVRRSGWYDISSFVYLNKSVATGNLVSEWSKLYDANPHVWDQALLSLAWYKTAQSEDLSSLFLNDGIFRFPRPWYRDVRDRLLHYPRKKKIRPFIDQKQASRQLKSFVSSSKKNINELGSDNIHPSFQEALKQLDFSSSKDVKSIFTKI